MISEREEYEFKDGGTLVLTNGEDGVNVEINIGKPMKGAYNDMRKLAKDIGKYLGKYCPQAFWDDRIGSKVPEQDRELYKVAIRLRRINPKYTRIDYMVWLHGAEQPYFAFEIMEEFVSKDGSTISVVHGENDYTIHLHKVDDGTLKVGTYTSFDKICSDIGSTFFHTPYVDEFPKLYAYLKKVYPKYTKSDILVTLKSAARNVSCFCQITQGTGTADTQH